MTEWWQTLSDAARLFWSIAIGATFIQILLFAASFLGGHDFDHSPDGAETDSVEGVKLVSIRAIIAFLVGFGWTGGLLLAKGLSLLTVVAAALAVGLVFMAVIFLIMRAMMSLRADGTLDYANAIGVTGRVYVTIPAKREGSGQVEIMIQGRLATVQAVTESDHALSPQTSVKVTAVDNGNILVVTPNL